MRLFEIPASIMLPAVLCFCAGLYTPPAHADFVFGEPTNLGPVINSSYIEGGPCVTADGLEMYFGSDRPDGYGGVDAWVSRRATRSDDWGTPKNLGPQVNSAYDEVPYVTPDGLRMCLESNRHGGYGAYDVWMSERSSREDPWGEPENLGPQVNSGGFNGAPWISQDGLVLYFAREVEGQVAAIWMAERATEEDPWGEPVRLAPPVNSAHPQAFPYVSPDGLLLLFADAYDAWFRPGGYGKGDMWMAKRASTSDAWETVENLGPKANSPYLDFTPRLSSDGRTLYFSSLDRPSGYGSTDIWQVPIVPFVDFNGDGKVAGREVTEIAEYWGQDEPLCDIGPTPFGDGIVDAKDLVVVAEYIGNDIEDPSLVAHWAFDENEGSVATDSAGDCDGTLFVGATWQPDKGMIGGAIQCDGVTGCVLVDSIPDLGTGPFSVLAWVKGGEPGEIILCHAGATDWLMANPIDGSLMTKLTSSGRSVAYGFSDVVIMDGKWHRIGLVWDGTDRILYVDSQEVARDPQEEITISDGSLMIGASKDAATLWSGLIDDVRIYNRVVRP